MEFGLWSWTGGEAGRRRGVAQCWGLKESGERECISGGGTDPGRSRRRRSGARRSRVSARFHLHHQSGPSNGGDGDEVAGPWALR